MTCRYIDLSSPPYDEQTVQDEYDDGDCQGVEDHFDANPINVGDCIEIDGKHYRILAVKVKCSGSVVYSAGDPPQGRPPDHTHSYQNSPVVIELWLEEI